MTKTICLNSAPRTANTYLFQAIQLAIKMNPSINKIDILHHIHSPKLFIKNPPKNTFQYTNFRDPMDVIISSKVYFEGRLLDQTEEVRVHAVCLKYSEYIENAVSNTKITPVMFDNIVNNTHEVLEKILKDVNLLYYKKIDLHELKMLMYKHDKDVKENNKHMPHSMGSLDEINRFKAIVSNNEDYLKLQVTYDNAIKQISKSGRKIY